MNVLLIIQARMGSTRLPGKVLKQLGNYDVLTYVVERCRKIQNVDEVIVATSILKSDDLIEKWCDDNQVTCFRGSEDDVLSRYYQCAKKYDPDYIIRVTADCPFVDFRGAEEIINVMFEHPSDIVLIEGDQPRGLAVEMVSFKALEYMYKHGKENRHREHVTYYAYEKEHAHEFTRTTYKVRSSLNFPHLRITLDLEEDYKLCQHIANHFKDEINISSDEVVQYLISHPEVAHINSHIEQKPVL